MTRDEAVSFLKHLLFEDRATSVTGIATEPNLIVSLDAANKNVWTEAVDMNPRYFTVQSLENVVTDGSLPLANFDANGVYLVTRVQVLDSDGWWNVDKIVEKDSSAFEPDPETSQDTESKEYFGYYVEGDRLYLWPPGTGEEDVRIRYVPEIGSLVSGTGTTPLLNGKLSAYHQMVVYDAAIELATKDDARIGGWVKRRDELRARLSRYLRSRTRGEPLYIRILDA